MARISLKAIESLRSNLKLKAVAAETLKNRFKDDSRKVANPGVYGANETYVQINELGPVVEDLVDGVKALEDELDHIHQYIAGQLGQDADKMILPPNLKFSDSLGREHNLISFNEATGVSEINVDELYVGLRCI